MKLPHPIPYSGSKRNLAEQILTFFPKSIGRLIEPFAGSAAITLATAFNAKTGLFWINDVNKPLIELLEMMVNEPEQVVSGYKKAWDSQLYSPLKQYAILREKFNESKDPVLLLFLLARCVKAAVRYNAYGEFNQSPDKRRLGKHPDTMKNDIFSVSHLLKSKTTFTSHDYKKVFSEAAENDLIYMDPPYQGTGKTGGFNYAGSIVFDEFIGDLHDLNSRNISYILSFDGKTGEKTYGSDLPKSLNLYPIELKAGRSSQSTLLNRQEHTFEMLYLSPALMPNIDLDKILTMHTLQADGLFAMYGQFD
jgi:DNA adenine methylase